MPIPDTMNPQRDFSAGEYDPSNKRRDDTPAMRAAARQMSNWRIRNSGSLDVRPGRRAVIYGFQRVDEVTVSPGLTYRLCFANATLHIVSSAGAQLATDNGRPWTAGTVSEIVWSLVQRDALTRDVIISYRNSVPRIARWTLAGGWTFLNFSFGSLPDGGFEMPFFRLAPASMTLVPSAQTGAITVQTSAAFFTPDMVGNIIRWFDRQIRLDSYTDSTHMGATVLQELPITQRVTLTAPVVGAFNVGDIVETTETGNKAEVAALNLGATPPEIYITYLIPGFTIQAPQHLVGPTGTVMTAGTFVNAQLPSIQWDEQAFGGSRGWPASNFFDQNRLGFCDMPSLPGGIAWSALGQFDNYTIGANPNDAIFEVAPETSRVYHVAGKGDELAFTDRGVFNIPISTSNPLKPGSVQFLKLGTDASAQLRPVEATEGILYVNAGRNRVIAVVNTGVQNQPWRILETSLNQAHLFRNVIALAAASGDGVLPERYVYALNGDGTLSVGKFNAGDQWTGWLPWTSTFPATWVSALGGTVLVCTTYAASVLTEQIDTAVYLDGAVLYNAPPAAMANAGKGPLWWLPSQAVTLIDGLRDMGEYQTDANGFIIPNNPGEDLSSATLMGGIIFAPTLEPFVPNAQGGQDAGQRVRRRRIKNAAITVQNSTGFVFGKSRIPAYDMTEDAGGQPTQRETTYTTRPLGRAYDPPPPLVIKDRPGPLTVVEYGLEVSV